MDRLPKVLVTRQLPAVAMEMLTPHADCVVWEQERAPVTADFLARHLPEVEGVLSLLTERWTADRLALAPRLRVIANMAVGVDNIDIAACTARKVLVTNTPDVLTESTADLAFALLLATARRLPQAEAALRGGRWGSWYPMQFVGQDLFGATIGILGMGRIGRAVARRAAGFGMRVLYHNRRPDPGAAGQVGAEYCNLDVLLTRADFLVVLVPLSPQSRGLVGRRELALMKPTASLINVARGGVVDEAALYEALAAGRLWGAGLDVWAQEPVPIDHPLLTLPNVVALPHIGSATERTRTRMAMLAAENLAAVLVGRPPLTPVNSEVL